MRPSVCFVTRELYPFWGAGIGVQVAGTLAALADACDLTVVTTAAHRERFERCRGSLPRWLQGVQVAFVTEPEQRGEYYNHMHAYSAGVFECLRELFPRRGPDLIEFPDYLAEGLVTVQAKRAKDPWLRNTAVATRIYTTAELCAVLDGHLPQDFETATLLAAERYCLSHADALLWAGGDVLASYQRYYGGNQLAPAFRIRHALPDPEIFQQASQGPDDPRPLRPLRFLYMGRLERRKGVEDLVEAFLSLAERSWELTLVGGDTETGPLGASLRVQLETVAAGDPRIRFESGVPRTKLAELLAKHDVVVCPSLWENWPTVVLEAFACNRPVLATPVGGLTEMVRSEDAGWLARSTGASALADAAEELVRNPQVVRTKIAEKRPRRAFNRLADPKLVRAGYDSLIRSFRDRAKARYIPCSTPYTYKGGREARLRLSTPRATPLVSIVIPYFRMHKYVEEAVQSAVRQTHERIEVIVVNDGSFEPEARILDLLVTRYGVRVFTQHNQGLGAARNAGIAHARGRYVVPLDADDVLEPRFVERTLEALRGDPSLCYVTTWSLYVDDSGEPLGNGYQPLGNEARELLLHGNVAGPATALMPTAIFHRGFQYTEDLVSYEDWDLYARFAEAGLYGCVIPERLFRYRVRGDSMLRSVSERRMARLHGELAARRKEGQSSWTCRNA